MPVSANRRTSNAEQPNQEHREALTKVLGDALTKAHAAKKGMVLRRLNRREYENTMNDFFGSNLGNASSHDWHNLPMIVAGGGYKHGSYFAHDTKNNTPLANLFVALAQ